jgi:hypothetical protein
MHATSLFADLLGEVSPRADLLHRSMEIIGEEGAGVIVFVNRPTSEVSRAFELREQARAGNMKPIEELRDYGVGAQILAELGFMRSPSSPTPITRLSRWRAMASPSWANAAFKDNLMAKFLIVEARFYDHLNDQLVAGAKAAIKAAGHKSEVITVPGALEIPAAIALADRRAITKAMSPSAW